MDSTARLHISSAKARELAETLLKYADMVDQSDKPNGYAYTTPVQIATPAGDVGNLKFRIAKSI